MQNERLTCALGLDGGVCACPAGAIPCPGVVVVVPTEPCTPELRGRWDGGTRAAPGGGEEVPVGGEEVSVLWLGSTDVEDEAELWSLKRERSFLSRAWISSRPALLTWNSAASDSTSCDWTWLWPDIELGRGSWVEMGTGWYWVACMDEPIGWEDVTPPLKDCCSEAETLPVVLGEESE